jgi:serine/threonine protein kinase
MSPSESHLIPAVIGRYRVLQKFRAGGLWDAYLAADPELNRNAEIRVAKSEELNPWVLNEARVLASLQHPEILPVYDIGSFGAHSDDVDQSFQSDADQIGARRRRALSV